MRTSDLFVWTPSRSSKFTRIENPALDDSGANVDLYDGATVTVRHLNFFKSDKAQIPDLLYDVGLSLIVSERAWGIIGSANVPGVEAHPATLWDRNRRACGRLFWLNVVNAVPLLDRETSTFRASESGVILREISNFVVDDTRVPDEDLFLCDDGGMKIFSRRLLEKIKAAGLNGAKFRPLQGTSWP